MRVTHRLYFAALPSVVGALAVAGLAYWGQYSRTVAEVILVIAIGATLTTLVMSWINVRYVAQRVERLAHIGGRASNAQRIPRNAKVPSTANHPGDELDTIERVVARLNDAVQSTTEDRARDVAYHEQRRREYAEILAAVALSGERELDEVRLPLHILLENHFGELNENQEEMLGAARVAAEKIANELTAMAELARMELGQTVFRHDRVFPADLINAILPTLRAQATGRDIDLRADIAPLVPAFHVDASRLQQALQLVFAQCINAMPPDTQASLTLVGERDGVLMKMLPGAELATGSEQLLAQRVIEALGGSVLVDSGALTIRIRS